MKKFGHTLLGVSIFAMMPVIAGAAGTYYNGNSYGYAQQYGANRGGAYGNVNRGYAQNQQSMTVRNTTTRVTQKKSTKQQSSASPSKSGFQLGATFSHEFANWNFKMKEAKSKLSYDNVRWNVLSVDGAYYFGNSLPMQIKVGAKYGMQFGETSMIDDDISNGAYGFEHWYDDSGYYIGTVSGYAMSVGTSKDGTQMGFNAAFGLTDFFKWGNVKITPSIGYRYFKYKVETKNNSGLTMDVFSGNPNMINCIEVNGETQCDPLVVVGFYNGTSIVGTPLVGGREEVDTDGDGINDSLTDIYVNNAGGNLVAIDLGDTYYYHQSGASHKYETVWQGPYIAMDLEYAINNTNLINAGIEFGLPMYNAKGDQPYRIDWAHPTSVEDKGKLGKAYHLGLSTMWSTALSDSVMLSLGMTYDYYKVNDATAKTYLNGSQYQNALDDVNADIAALLAIKATNGSWTTDEQADYNALVAEQAVYNSYKANGWTIEAQNEIESVYSAMGLRLGVNVKF